MKKKKINNPVAHPYILEICKTLKTLRIEKNISQEYMAYKLGTSQNSYSKIENGHTPLYIDRLLEIVELLGTDFLSVLPQDKIYQLPETKTTLLEIINRRTG